MRIFQLVLLVRPTWSLTSGNADQLTSYRGPSTTAICRATSHGRALQRIALQSILKTLPVPLGLASCIAQLTTRGPSPFLAVREPLASAAAGKEDLDISQGEAKDPKFNPPLRATSCLLQIADFQAQKLHEFLQGPYQTILDLGNATWAASSGLACYGFKLFATGKRLSRIYSFWPGHCWVDQHLLLNLWRQHGSFWVVFLATHAIQASRTDFRTGAGG